MSTIGIDWSQLWYPGRRQPFSAEQLQRAGQDAPTLTLWVVVGVQSLALLMVTSVMVAAPLRPALLGVEGLTLLAGVALGRWLWRNPWRGRLLVASLMLVVVILACAIFLKQHWTLPERRSMADAWSAIGMLVATMLWTLTVWRAQHIEAKLREQDEREQAIDMARRLATAQIAPHFLFNTLSTVQYWVQTQDPRAPGLLASLTGYLRATLPLFDRPFLPLADEVTAVTRYLEVMQARLGDRLRFHMEIDPDCGRTLVPPGLLLTLVENAVGHGLEPSISGGELWVKGHILSTHLCLSVQDSGQGLPPAYEEGQGLRNVRERLRLAYADQAHLQLSRPSGGGCLAEIRLPLSLPAMPSSATP